MEIQLRRLIRLCCVLTCLMVGLVQAAVPEPIPFSGKLDTGGTPFSGEISVTFSLYSDPTSSTPVLWTDTQSISVVEGRFHTALSGVDNSLLSGGILHLGIQVANDPEMSPRIALLSVPFARQADNALTLGGKANTEFADSSHTHPLLDLEHTNCSEGQVLTSDGSAWTCGAPPLLIEDDPQVGANTTHTVPKWDGTALVAGTITDTGNIGIGTTEPNTKLHVQDGQVRIQNAGGPHLYITDQTAGGADAEIRVSSSTFRLGKEGGNSLFGVHLDTGNVGIGFAEPGAKLDVNGNVIVRTNLHLGASGKMFARTGQTALDMVFGAMEDSGYAALYAGGSERIRISPTGNVGIGLTAPSEKLEVDGTVKATAFVGDGSGLTGVGGKWSDVTGGIAYTGGSVGIGITTPGGLLSVGQPTTCGSGHMDNGDGTCTATFTLAIDADGGQIEEGNPGYEFLGNTYIAPNKTQHGSWIALIIGVGLARWDTSAIPDNATIVSATFRGWIIPSSLYNDANRNIIGQWYDAGAALDFTDWAQTLPTHDAHSGVSLSAFTESQYNDIVLHNVLNVSKTGYTGLRFGISGTETKGGLYSLGNNGLSFCSSASCVNEHNVNRPQLIVTYGGAHGPFVVANDMKVGIGKADPQYPLDVLGDVHVQGRIRSACSSRLKMYQNICYAHAAANGWSQVAAVSAPMTSQDDHTGTDVCQNYVGNNAITAWTCHNMPYVYPSSTGGDIRPNWQGCGDPLGYGNYTWFNPEACTGLVMVCCYK